MPVRSVASCRPLLLVAGGLHAFSGWFYDLQHSTFLLFGRLAHVAFPFKDCTRLDDKTGCVQVSKNLPVPENFHTLGRVNGTSELSADGDSSSGNVSFDPAFGTDHQRSIRPDVAFDNAIDFDSLGKGDLSYNLHPLAQQAYDRLRGSLLEIHVLSSIL